MHRESVGVQRVKYAAGWGAVVLVATACYSYVPVGQPSLGAGDEVRVHLTPSGASDLAREIGPRMASVDGRVLQLSPDSSLTLAVIHLRSMRGDLAAWQGDAPLVIPLSAMASVDRRRLARGRTIAASTGAAAAVAAIGIYAVSRAGKGSGRGGPPPPPPP